MTSILIKAAGAGLFAAALFAGPVSAAAPLDPSSVLQRLCVATGGQADVVLAQADAEGWQPASDELKTQLSLGEMKVAGLRVNHDRDVEEVLFAGASAVPSEGRSLPTRVCGLFARPVDVSQVRSAVAAWVGVPRSAAQSSPNMDAYAYTDANGGVRTALADPDGGDAKRLMESGAVRILFVGGGGQFLKIEYFVPKM